MKNKVSNYSRRNFLAGSATIAGLAAASAVLPASIAQANHTDPKAKAKGLPDFAKWKKRSAVIVHSKSGIETHREDIGSSVITPIRHIYVRNNLPTMTDEQIGNKDNWTLSVEGVKNPTTFTLKQIKSLGFTTVATVLQCSGNGRGFFKHGPTGSQWKTGAAACVVWTGIPVTDLINQCGGLASGVKFITGTGGDLPAGQDPKRALIERSLPLAAHKDAILAWEMNGVDLPNVHGAPLRLVTPGYFGINNVKHLSKLSFTKAESDVRFMKSSYRIYPIGKKGSPEFPTCAEMPVKSWITKPNDDSGKVASGNVVITGVAMGGMESVSKVEVSIDSGKTWKKANIVGPDLGKFAWRQFAIELNLKPGTYNIASRASAGSKSQPELRMENHRGYLHNGWKDHSVNITVA
jgi:sulfite dehydrogenase